MSGPVDSARPKVLFVYYSFTKQSPRVVDAMADALRERGCDVDQALFEFTDKRCAGRSTRIRIRDVWRDVLGMAPAQLRNATGEIVITEEPRNGAYDLICIGSPTWC